MISRVWAVLLLFELPASAEGLLASFGRGRLLKVAVEDPDPTARERAVRALGRDGSPHAARALGERLGAEPDGRVRVAIADALGAIGDRAAVEPLAVLLGRSGDPARPAAARALGRIADPRALGALEEAATDRAAGEEALRAIARIGGEAMPRALALLRDPERAVSGVRILGAIADPRAVPALCGLLSDERAPLRVEAVRSLGAIRDTRASPCVDRARRDGDERVRQAAEQAEGAIAPAPDPILEAPRDLLAASATSRAMAAASIVAAGDLSRTADLVRIASRPGEARREALRALALLMAPRPGLGHVPRAGDDVHDLAARSLGSRDDAIAAGGALLAGSIGSSAAALRRALGDGRRTPAVRRAAAIALGRMRDVGTLRAAADRERDPSVRAAIARALGESGAARAVPALVRMLRRSDDASASAASALATLADRSALTDLRSALGAADPVLRAAAAGALARAGDGPSRRRLAVLADEDPAPIVRRAAARAAGPVPRGESLLWWRSGTPEAGRRVVVETADGRVWVEWTDAEGDVVMTDLPMGMVRLSLGTGAGEAEAVPTR